MRKLSHLLALFVATAMWVPALLPAQYSHAVFVEDASVPPFVPPRAGDGDPNFGGPPWPVAEVAAVVKISDDRCSLLAALYMDAVEPTPDSTRVTGWSDWTTVYRAEEGYNIDMVWPVGEELRDEAQFQGTGHNEPPLVPGQCGAANCTTNGLVKTWSVVLDTPKNDEAGRLTKVSATFHTIGLVIREAYRNDYSCSSD